MSLLFFLPLLSGLWSEDKQLWWKVVVIKAPLWFLPLAFARPFRFRAHSWHWLAVLFIFLMLASTGWSFFHYMQHFDAVNTGYEAGRSMPGFLENDRVRFSLLIALSVLVSVLLATSRRLKQGLRIFALLAAGWFVIYLHLLSVRTGLLAFYVMAIAGLAKLPRRLSLPLLLVLISLPVAAYLLFPSFEKRVLYFRHELPYLRNAAFFYGGNDVTRVISINGGWEVMNRHPFSGTGTGDLDSTMNEWYRKNYPQIPPEQRIAPGSEWLIYGATLGWPGLIFFTAVLLVPFFVPERRDLPFLLIHLAFAFSLLFDIGLEVQFGVFIYSFITLAWWRRLRDRNPEHGKLQPISQSTK